MKRRFIVKNFLLFFCSFTIPTLLVGMVMLYASFRTTSRETEARLDNSLTLALENLDIFLVDTDTVNYYFEDGRQTVHFYAMMSSEKIEYPSLVTLKYINAFINAINSSKGSLDSLYIYMPNEFGRTFTSSRSIVSLAALPDKGWEREFDRNPPGHSWAQRRIIRQYDFEEPYPVVSVYRRFQLYPGGVVANYKLSHLEQVMNAIAFQDRQALVMVGEGGSVLFGNSGFSADVVEELLARADWGELSATVVLKSGRYWVKSVPYPPLDARVLTFVPMTEIYKDVMKSLLSTLLLLALITVITICMAFYAANKSFQQLEGIIDIFDRAQTNRPLPSVTPGKEDLFTYILNNVTRTFVERSYLQVELSRRKYKLKVAELMALQYQINPHFLFNTLQTINYEVLTLTGGQDTQANRMVEELSDILRYSLQSPDSLVALETEIAHCQKYVSIQTVRYDNRFTVAWDVDESVLCQTVPRLILQPLLENCIQHGVRFRRKGAVSAIKLKITLRGARLHFRMIDNGAGIPQERLAQVRKALATDSESGSPVSEHIGLSNCSQRLVLHYSPESRLYIRSRENRGTVVWFSIPLSDEA